MFTAAVVLRVKLWAITWIELKVVMVSKASQKEKDKLDDFVPGSFSRGARWLLGG